jgi:peptide-methionine (S)-S-oxide reductase
MKIILGLALFFAVAVGISCGVAGGSSQASGLDQVPPPALTETETAKGTTQTAVFAGGCFWGVEAVFEHVKGVTDVKSGYAGGEAKDANYDTVSEGETGHAEAVIVTYDPAKVSYDKLLEVFFSVAHDPTELNRQGPDTGRQYRSAIFYANEEQKAAATAFIEKLGNAKTYAKPIVTEVSPLKKFYVAEAYHQDYLVNHPNERYIVVNDKPKVEALKKQFPQLYVQK